MKTINVIFIGAGTANLTAANVLLDNGISDFLIFEKGAPIKKRHCPGEKLFTCKFCSQGCYTTEGVGGANALHGNKICYFPASNGIENSLQFDLSVYDYVDKLLRPYVDTTNIGIGQNDSDTKFYNSDVLNQNHFYELVNMLSIRLADKIIFARNIVDVTKKGNEFLVATDKNEHYSCKNVVIGSGRSSYKWAKNIFRKLGINYTNQLQDIGIRVETSVSYFSEKYLYQVDPKFKFQFGDVGSARTFCAHNQGKVVPVQFGKSFYADGAFGDHFGDENNIALMVRANEHVENDFLENWCSRINQLYSNQLILNRISVNRFSKEQVVDHIMDNIPHFPIKIHDKLMRLLLEKLIVEDNKLFNEKWFENGYLTLYGPALDLYWPKPQLNGYLESVDLANFYVIGDAAGISRGFFQGIYSGAGWVKGFIDETKANKIENDKIWSGGISSGIR